MTRSIPRGIFVQSSALPLRHPVCLRSRQSQKYCLGLGSALHFLPQSGLGLDCKSCLSAKRPRSARDSMLDYEYGKAFRTCGQIFLSSTFFCCQNLTSFTVRACGLYGWEGRYKPLKPNTPPLEHWRRPWATALHLAKEYHRRSDLF